MYILGIESSCDETAAAVLKAEDSNIEVLSNIVSSQVPVHALFGGVVPEIASRAHCEAISNVVHQAVTDSGIELGSIGAIAVTYAPGLIGSLLVGVNFAKSLADTLNIPLIPVNHIKAHVSAAFVEHSDLKPPFCALVVSGGHTSIYSVKDYLTYEEIGGTRDDACGEAFDKVGRVMGLPYPGGAAMDRLASLFFDSFESEYIKFPSPAVNDETLDFSFSGLKTAVINYINTEKQKNHIDDIDENEKIRIAGSFTRAICEGITKKLSSAIDDYKFKTVVLAGGVAANSHLRLAVMKLCEKKGIRFIVPSLKYCGDNGVMTASAGYFLDQLGIKADSSLNAYASDETADEYFENLLKNIKESKR